MKYYIFLFLTLLTGCSDSDKADFIDESGNYIYLNNHPGEYIIIHYWEKNEPKAIKSIEALNLIHNDPRVKSVIGVEFTGLTNKELKDLKKSLNIEYPLTNKMDTGKYLIIPPLFTPITFVIKDGQLILTIDEKIVDKQLLNKL